MWNMTVHNPFDYLYKINAVGGGDDSHSATTCVFENAQQFLQPRSSMQLSLPINVIGSTFLLEFIPMHHANGTKCILEKDTFGSFPSKVAIGGAACMN